MASDAAVEHQLLHHLHHRPEPGQLPPPTTSNGVSGHPNITDSYRVNSKFSSDLKSENLLWTKNPELWSTGTKSNRLDRTVDSS